MLRLLIVACVLGLSAGTFGPGKLVKKYAYGKIIESCFGKEIVADWKKRIMDSIGLCQGEEIVIDDSKIPTPEALLQSLRRGAMQEQQIQQPMLPMLMTLTLADSIQMIPSQQPSKRRRRQIGLTAEKMSDMREKMIAKLSNITCVMKNLNFANDDLTPNVEYWTSIYDEMNIDPNLKADMLNNVETCNKFATCMPVEHVKNPLMQEMGTLITFMKCECMQKGMACMKNDMRKDMGEAVAEAESKLAEQGLSFGEEGGDPLGAAFEMLAILDDPIFNTV